jgi:hypothetical protein
MSIEKLIKDLVTNECIRIMEHTKKPKSTRRVTYDPDSKLSQNDISNIDVTKIEIKNNQLRNNICNGKQLQSIDEVIPEPDNCSNSYKTGRNYSEKVLQTAMDNYTKLMNKK